MKDPELKNWIINALGHLIYLKKISKLTFRINPPQLLIDWKIHNSFHASLLKPYKENLENRFDFKESPPPPILLASQEPNIEVKKLFSKRFQNGKEGMPIEVERLRPSRKLLVTHWISSKLQSFTRPYSKQRNWRWRWSARYEKRRSTLMTRWLVGVAKTQNS